MHTWEQATICKTSKEALNVLRKHANEKDENSNITQRVEKMSNWMDRILDIYHRSVNRIRRSYALGRVSLVRIRRNTKSGQASPWSYQTVTDHLIDSIDGMDWIELAHQIESKDVLI